jgi:hypothetical protein
MKSSIRNKSELIELRFCYVLLVLSVTLFLAYGGRRFLAYIPCFLPFVRMIRLYSFLPKFDKITTGIIHFVLIALFYLYFMIPFLIPFERKNEDLVTVFAWEVLFVIIFHRYVFFSKRMFLSQYLISFYKICMKIYADIIAVVISCFILFYGNSYSFFKNFWYDMCWIFYLYLFYLVMASILLVAGKIHLKVKERNEINKLTFEKHFRPHYRIIKRRFRIIKRR